MTVDIIIPTYNRASLLSEALKSVQSQTYEDWLCWIAEDGESPKTRDAVRPFLADKRFIYLPGKHIGYPAAPRNRAIRQGSAQLVAFLDDDDLWFPAKLERQVEFLEHNTECVLLGTNALRWDGICAKEDAPLYHQKISFGLIPYKKLVQENVFIISSVLTRREILLQAGLFNKSLTPPVGEDYELWLRLGAMGETWMLAEPLLVYRESRPTYYAKKMDRETKYRLKADIYSAALQGMPGYPSPLDAPGKKYYAALCRAERDFYRAGPRFMDRFRRTVSKKIKSFAAFQK
ncbi:MAG: glycosyltransferase family A protein [Deltaproteobacteria bacterium]|nr:glycosyltransferase family A protein [Deltaproteobacteria bacterium]